VCDQESSEAPSEGVNFLEGICPQFPPSVSVLAHVIHTSIFPPYKNAVQNAVASQDMRVALVHSMQCIVAYVTRHTVDRVLIGSIKCEL
jgi:hypothetical protein